MVSLDRSKIFISRNAPTILSCLGSAGVLATAILAVKATPKAIRLVEKAKEEKLTKLETVRVVGPVYIPAILTGMSTIACIFGANVLSKRKQASLMSAYALLENSYKEYRRKVVELYGEDADDRVKQEIAKAKYDGTDISDTGDRLFYDSFSDRYFESTIEIVQSAEYRINLDMSRRGYATVNEFYSYLGVSAIDGGNDIGWSTDEGPDQPWQSWIDFGHQKVIFDDGLECCIITMFAEPTLGWDDY